MALSQFSSFVAAAAACVLAAGGASAAELIANGGFETGGLSGWTVTDQAGSSGSWFIQSGTGSPLNSFSVPAPPQGSFAAMTDQNGSGSHLLTQGFAVPTGVISALLSFQLFYNNQAGAFFTPDSLDALGGFENQQFRADVMIGSPADLFSVAAGDVLQNLYQTKVGDPLTAGYNPIVVDLTALLQAHAGETLLLRFAEADNQLFLTAGVDAVSLDVVAAAPEPATLVVVGLGLAGLGLMRRKRAA